MNVNIETNTQEKPERDIKKYNHEYYIKNREKILLKRKQRPRTEKDKKYLSDYYQKNREKLIELNKKNYNDKRETILIKLKIKRDSCKCKNKNIQSSSSTE